MRPIVRISSFSFRFFKLAHARLAEALSSSGQGIRVNIFLIGDAVTQPRRDRSRRRVSTTLKECWRTLSRRACASMFVTRV
jgi:sulfur relay (sulfurtransferase) complex TusBCD TusD component (DsrE family)